MWIELQESDNLLNTVNSRLKLKCS